jgi:hypothetical protein
VITFTKNHADKKLGKTDKIYRDLKRIILGEDGKKLYP